MGASSAFPQEEEVLLQAGIKFRVVSISEDTVTVDEPDQEPL